jgi:hypothetical protein
MLDARIEVESETLKTTVDAIYRAMANQMAQAEALHSGKSVHPNKFYSGLENKAPATEAIDLHGFALLKAAFSKREQRRRR